MMEEASRNAQKLAVDYLNGKSEGAVRVALIVPTPYLVFCPLIVQWVTPLICEGRDRHKACSATCFFE